MSEFNLADYQYVLWDFDGVLGDNVPIHNKSRLRAYAEIGEEKQDLRYMNISHEIHEEAHLHGSHPEAINAWILAQAGIIKDAADLEHPAVVEICDRKRQIYYREAAKGLPAFDGMPELIRKIALHHGPNRQAIVSTAGSREVLPFLGRHGLNNYFRTPHLILAKEHPDVVNLKPAPDAYELAGRVLGVDAVATVTIEDSEHGIEAANRFGSFVIGVANTRSVEHLEALQGHQRPRLVQAGPTELAATLGFPSAA